ncbi:hypothetical protein [Rhizobium favelukesii]|uniref:DUF4376 domain-containing protein n=1 Tax=Rhizobium favelukesii TaxID=348824 RepID=W6S0D0_9HYPH|nr:hypothetical protein [Rhizobium favelukesii]MCS0463503.1 hypothetical protein [Rhizobium favelukesii]CDM59921.1 hypothetical protein LPU83_pLPU83a_0080 [Rhizobium favelukesii]
MNVYYVQRRDGKIVSVSPLPQEGFDDIAVPIDDPELVTFFNPPGPDPATLKQQLRASIDIAAETERLKYITGGSGQAMPYQQKSDEAKRYLAAIEASEALELSSFPLLAAEVGITAPTIGEVANVIYAAFTQWQVIGGAIEAVRLGTKAAIEIAVTVAEAETAAAAASWPNA